jgi:hypothetical protein
MLLDFAREILWRYRLRKARWELELRDRHEAAWRAEERYMHDLLKSIGKDPDQMPEPITKYFEFWIVALTLLFAGLCWWMWNDLVRIIQEKIV